MTPDELRTRFLSFYQERGHAIVPSVPLVPENDPTTLFTGSGMQPMLPNLLGEPHPLGTRVCDSQKCLRAQDIEDVGDNRHTTFFEMLGNWSFGDYFKQEQLTWIFTFLTQELRLEPHRLYVTVFSGDASLGLPRDHEAIKLWQELFSTIEMPAPVVEHPDTVGMGDGRIFLYGVAENWWSRAGAPDAMPVGEPGGGDSEIFYDFGPEHQFHEQSPWRDQPCHVNCDCGRFLEICNNVFMEYQKTAETEYAPLPSKNVDFGGGFERLLAAQNHDPDVFRTGVLFPIIQELEQLSGRAYGDDSQTTRSFRVIADHFRAAVMLAADGVLPGNKRQGYILRRLIRRSLRYARMIGIETSLAEVVVPVVSRIYGASYPVVAEKSQIISTTLAGEERKFAAALKRGLREIEKHDELTESIAFELYQTHGFPFELTQEIAAERGEMLDLELFEAERQRHAVASRSVSAGTFKGGLADQSELTTAYHTATHLLHAALRQVIGASVEQRGSHITGERLRFDFSHTAALTDEQKAAVETLINGWILADLPVTREELSKQDALASGAIAFFIDKYPDQVSVYTIGSDPDTDWISKEFCGGPHVARTGEIGKIELYKDTALGAGVRRVYARQVSD